MAAPLTQVEADRIVATSKYIDAPVIWSVGAHEAWAKASVPVQGSAQTKLELRATAHLLLPERFSFVLLVNASFPIRRLCSQNAHRNNHPNDKSFMASTHLHTWTEQCRDRIARAAPEISTDIREALEQFCEVCNIEFRSSVGSLPPYQSSLVIEGDE